MANLIVGVDVAQAPTNTRRRQSMVYTGTRRKMIKQLLHYAEAVSRGDARAAQAGIEQNYNAAEFAVSRGSTTDKALKHIIARAKEALTQTA